MNIDELRRSWNAIDADTREIDAANSDFRRKIESGTVTSARSRLLRTLRMQQVLILVGLFAIRVLWNFNPLLTGLCLLFFIIMGVLVSYEFFRLRSISFPQIPVAQARWEIYAMKRRYFWYRVVGMTLGIPLVGWMLWFFYGIDTGMFIGGCTGAVIGLAIGISINIRRARLLRQMRREIDEEMAG